MVTRFGGMADEHDPIVSSQLLRSRGTRPLYQIRIGADTRTEANSLCQRIRKAGGACMVLRQPRAVERDFRTDFGTWNQRKNEKGRPCGRPFHCQAVVRPLILR